MDLDGTLTLDISQTSYEDKPLNQAVYRKLLKYKEMGFYIAIFTSRNMNTYQGNIEKIKAQTLPSIIQWLDKHQVPYDEVIIGKAWCGFDGFYIDDKAIRPSEFVALDYPQILELLDKEK
nr:capsular biosynthesis protein [Helicobacter sp.]